jgi:hypothetical protein
VRSKRISWIVRAEFTHSGLGVRWFYILRCLPIIPGALLCHSLREMNRYHIPNFHEINFTVLHSPSRDHFLQSSSKIRKMMLMLHFKHLTHT